MERTHYIFVDFENVQGIDIDLIAGKSVFVVMVLGKKHTSLPVPLVTKLLKYPSQVRLVETQLTGKNALDFVLSYEVGVLSVSDSEGHFHILSRDKGFDALIQHLNGKDINAARHDMFSRIPVLGAAGHVAHAVPSAPSKAATATTLPKKSATPLSPAERVEKVAERLQKSVSNRPKRKKTLLSHINGLFSNNKLSEPELQAILDALIARDVIEFGPKEDVIYKI